MLFRSDYIAKQKKAVYTTGYAENPFGRRRYFFKSPIQSVMKAQERESVNFPVQSTVADLLYLAMGNFMQYRVDHPHLRYRLMLPFHDAVYLQVWWEDVHEVIDKVIPYCMVDNASVPSIDLRLQTDAECMYHWEHKDKNPDVIIAESLADYFKTNG